MTSSCKRCAFLEFLVAQGVQTWALRHPCEGDILVLRVNSLVTGPRFKLRPEVAQKTFVHDLQHGAAQGHQSHTRQLRAKLVPACSATAAAASNANRSTRLSCRVSSSATASERQVIQGVRVWTWMFRPNLHVAQSHVGTQLNITMRCCGTSRNDAFSSNLGGAEGAVENL